MMEFICLLIFILCIHPPPPLPPPPPHLPTHNTPERKLRSRRRTVRDPPPVTSLTTPPPSNDLLNTLPPPPMTSLTPGSNVTRQLPPTRGSVADRASGVLLSTPDSSRGLLQVAALLNRTLPPNVTPLTSKLNTPAGSRQLRSIEPPDRTTDFFTCSVFSSGQQSTPELKRKSIQAGVVTAGVVTAGGVTAGVNDVVAEVRAGLTKRATGIEHDAEIVISFPLYYHFDITNPPLLSF